MPRKSFSELTIVPPHRGGASTRPAPPADLDANERRLWLELVNSCAPTHFRPSDGPPLRAYVSAIGLHERAAAALKTGMAAAERDELDWLITTQAKTVRMMCSLSVKLRLNPQARMGQQTAPRAGSPPSFYQTRAQQQHDPDLDDEGESDRDEAS